MPIAANYSLPLQHQHGEDAACPSCGKQNDMKTIKRIMIWTCIVALSVFAVAVTGGSFYMLDYSLAPAPNRADTAACFSRQFERYPETKEWVDSLRQLNALRDTMMTMDSGERHHALYVERGSGRTALVLHGWRNCGIDFLYLARMYERELGCNVVVPDLHAHGLSEGEAIGMGWNDAQDAMQWLKAFKTDTMVVHGVSMGGATTMMLSGMEMPDGVSEWRFVDDCGYTSVWDEFAGEMRAQFDLPEFPLMYTSSLLCKLRYGWSFGEASALRQVGKCRWPMLFIHGDSDKFVPTAMVHRLYAAKPAPKVLWITDHTAHACSYLNHRSEYIQRVGDFIR